jgi:hypothetical protein
MPPSGPNAARRRSNCRRNFGLSISLLPRHDAGLHQLPGIPVPDSGQVLDPVIHQRLGVRRLIALVVAVPTIPYQVDHHVLVEAIPVGHGQPHG